MNKDLDAFLNGVLPIAKGCPEPMALRAIREACIRLCIRTRKWRAMDAIVTSNMPDPYTVLPPAGAELHDIVRADFNGQPLEPQTPEWLDDNAPGWRYGTTGQPSYITQEAPGEIILAPSMAGELRVWITLRPAEDATQVPDWIWREHKDLVCSGALGQLLLMQGQPFYNPELGMAKANQFRDGLDSAASAARAGQQKARTRTRGSFM